MSKKKYIHNTAIELSNLFPLILLISRRKLYSLSSHNIFFNWLTKQSSTIVFNCFELTIAYHIHTHTHISLSLLPHPHHLPLPFKAAAAILILGEKREGERVRERVWYRESEWVESK